MKWIRGRFRVVGFVFRVWDGVRVRVRIGVGVVVEARVQGLGLGIES